MTHPNSAFPVASPAGAVPAAWTSAEIAADSRWIHPLPPAAQRELLDAAVAAHVPGKPLLAYRREDFPLHRALDPLARAFREVRDGRGMALVKGLPREGVSSGLFGLMTWAIGLHFGVARPQNRASAYLTEVKDVGGVYRSPTGRGYSSSAELDFHVDGSDVVLLSCFNQAPVGGMSLVASSAKAFETMTHERPDLAAALLTDFPYSRNGEHGDEAPWYPSPIFGIEAGRVFCRFNRNRVINAQQMAGVPRLTAAQQEAIDYLEAVVRRPDRVFTMHLEAGDLQLLCNHTMLHSRTSFEDHPDEARRRTLFRLWLATPDSLPLPRGWEGFWKTRLPGVVRGGLRGEHHDAACRAFDAAQGEAMGMKTLEAMA